MDERRGHPRSDRLNPHMPGTGLSPYAVDAGTCRNTTTLLLLSAANAAPLPRAPSRWGLRSQLDGHKPREFSADTLGLIAVYLVAVVAALIAPPAMAGALARPEPAPAGFAQRVHRSVSSPGGYIAEASALPWLTMTALWEADRLVQLEVAAAAANGVPAATLRAATTAQEAAEQALRPGGLAQLLADPGQTVRENFSAGNPGEPFVLGLYTSASLQVSASELRQVDRWLAENGLNARVTIAGTFMDFEFPNPGWNIPHDLEAAWKQGDIPFVNLAVGTTDMGPRSAADVAHGVTDDAIRTWAKLFAAWTEGGTKWAYIAPLQEMNGGWVSYGLDPSSYKQAYLRVQRIFEEEGVPEGSVVWVFAPNGWSEPGHEFEQYYPGDEHVDVVAFSAFNFGACSCYAKTWESFEGAFRPYLQRMREMAPGKPIFVAQTGTVAQGGDKDAWLLDTLTGLDNFDGLEAVLYFNVAKPEAGGASCPIVDWRLYNPLSGEGQQGFLAAMERMENRGRGGSSVHSSSQGPDAGSGSGEDERDHRKPKHSKELPPGHDPEESEGFASTSRQQEIPGRDREVN